MASQLLLGNNVMSFLRECQCGPFLFAFHAWQTQVLATFSFKTTWMASKINSIDKGWHFFSCWLGFGWVLLSIRWWAHVGREESVSVIIAFSRGWIRLSILYPRRGHSMKYINELTDRLLRVSYRLERIPELGQQPSQSSRQKSRLMSSAGEITTYV
jgi:hypothetical protein